ncbi:D-alanyl-D-alanine carboxypeptidase family protein, partial [Clostridiaceae bacterium HSG29]|nr:D-alanyl-D-alanine carboxypeptidase family protein [Clostridiaceae bacterium HSG29]
MKVKNVFIITIIFLLLLSSFSFSEIESESYDINVDDIESEAAILIDANTGQILFEKKIHEKLYPASTTKLLTALIIAENINLNQEVVIDKLSPFTTGSRIYVHEDEIFTVEQLLNALLIESANDVANALAIYYSGSVEEFAKVMNEKATSLGTLNSNFINPNGLNDKEHYTTAYDMSLISYAAYQNEIIRSIVSKYTYSIPPTNKVDETRYLKSSNKFLYSKTNSYLLDYRGKKIFAKYDIVNGMKTGYTDDAKNCLVSSAELDGRELIAVVLKATGRNIYTDSRKLIDYGFNEFIEKEFFKKNEKIKDLQLNNFKKSKIDVLTSNNIKVLLKKDYEESMISTETIISKLELPLKKNEVIGNFKITYNDKIISSFDLISNISVDNSVLLSDETVYIENKKDFNYINILSIFLKLIISFLIWRT